MYKKSSYKKKINRIRAPSMLLHSYEESFAKYSKVSTLLLFGLEKVITVTRIEKYGYTSVDFFSKIR